MQNLKLEAIRIGIERGVITFGIPGLTGIIRWRIKHIRSRGLKSAVDLVDPGAAFGVKRKMMRAGAISVVSDAGLGRIGRAHLEAKRGATRISH